MPAEPPRWSEERARVFFALWPDALAAKALERLALEVRPRFGGRAMRLDTLHLTLAFIGGVPRLRLPELIELGAGIGPRAFELDLDVLGQWQRKHIVWVGPSQPPQALLDLARELHERLVGAGFVLESRPWVPHVTLLRNAACETRRTHLETTLAWKGDGFVLVESRLQPSGPRYELLARWESAR